FRDHDGSRTAAARRAGTGEPAAARPILLPSARPAVFRPRSAEARARMALRRWHTGASPLQLLDLVLVGRRRDRPWPALSCGCRPARFATIVCPRASIVTSAAIFRARPAGVFIALVRKASAKRFSLLSVRNVRFARGLASMAARRSRGMVDAVVARIGAYAASQRPSAFAASTALRPWGVMRPAATSRATCPRLSWLHLLFRPSGVYRCRNDRSSKPLCRPSIQPQHKTTSSACAGVTDGSPHAFL